MLKEILFLTDGINREQLNSFPNTNLLKPEKIDDFMAGEMRVNEHPFLTTLHVVFVREHNRVAKLLKEYLPSALHQVRLETNHHTALSHSTFFILG